MKEKENNLENTNDESLDYAFALEQANHWIDSADSKTGIALSLVSITFTLYAGFLLDKQVFTADINPNNKTWLIVLTLLSFVAFALSLVFYCFVLIPRFKKPKTKDNPYYYYEVSMYKEPKDFVDRFINEKDNKLLTKGQLESLYVNSKIALKKMRRFRRGIIFTALFFLFSSACIILALFTVFPTQDVSQTVVNDGRTSVNVLRLIVRFCSY